MVVDLSELGWDDARSRQLSRSSTRFGDCRPARVSRVVDGVCALITVRGVNRASVGGGLLAGAARDPVLLPCPGDWVLVRRWGASGFTVEAVLTRRNQVVDQRSRRAVAANLDRIAVVEPLTRAPNLDRIAHLCGLAATVGVTATVVLTSGSAREDFGPTVAAVTDRFPTARVEVVRTDGPVPGVSLVAPGRTLALLGVESRTSLINTITGVTDLASRARRGGSLLIPVPAGGALLDLPDVAVEGTDEPDLDSHQWRGLASGSPTELSYGLGARQRHARDAVAGRYR